MVVDLRWPPFDDTCELLFGESEMGSEEEYWLPRKLGRYNDSSYNSFLNLTYVRQKFETLTSKLRTPELHFSFENEAYGSGFSVRKKLIFDDSSPLNFADAGSCDDVATNFGKSGDVAAIDHSSREVNMPSTSSENPKKKGSPKMMLHCPQW